MTMLIQPRKANPPAQRRQPAPRIHFPELPYSWRTVQRLCERILHSLPPLRILNREVGLLGLYAAHMPSGWHCPREYTHECYEGHVFLDGSVEYSIGKAQRVGRGGVVLHEPKVHHTWRNPTEDFRCLVFWFAMEPAVSVPVPRAWPVWPDILWDIALLFQEAHEGRIDWKARVAARTTVVLSRMLTLAKWEAEHAEPAADPDMERVGLVDRFLLAHVARSVRMPDIARHVGMCESGLRSHFRRLTGETVMQRLFYHRMDVARRLLGETDLPLARIAEAVGMPDPSYFCRRFRHAFRTTPFAYRREATRAAGGKPFSPRKTHRDAALRTATL